MTSPEAQALFGAAILKFDCTRSSAGQTADVTDGADAPLASVDGAGTVSDRSGNPLLRAPVVFEGRGDKGTDVKLEVSDAGGERLGEVRVTKYSFGPRSKKATLSATLPGGEEVAKLEPRDRGGEQLEIDLGGASGGTLQQVSRKRGILRSTSSYRLELTGEIDRRVRPLVLAAAIRYQAVATAAANASQRRE